MDKIVSPAEAGQVRKAVRTYITENFLLGGAEEFEDATQLMESGLLDSTAAMELVAFLEETFSFHIEEDEIVPENLNSVDAIAAFVAKKTV